MARAEIRTDDANICDSKKSEICYIILRSIKEEEFAACERTLTVNQKVNLRGRRTEARESIRRLLHGPGKSLCPLQLWNL